MDRIFTVEPIDQLVAAGSKPFPVGACAIAARRCRASRAGSCLTDSYSQRITTAVFHAGASVPSKNTPPSPMSATVQIILVPLANATRYLPPRLFESVVSSSKVSDSSVPLGP